MFAMPLDREMVDKPSWAEILADDFLGLNPMTRINETCLEEPRGRSLGSCSVPEWGFGGCNTNWYSALSPNAKTNLLNRPKNQQPNGQQNLLKIFDSKA
ncbi:hypothetical protein V6N13_103315 [Hibiscus sabdariffa]